MEDLIGENMTRIEGRSRTIQSKPRTPHRARKNVKKLAVVSANPFPLKRQCHIGTRPNHHGSPQRVLEKYRVVRSVPENALTVIQCNVQLVSK
jgi:hypothetical protein